MTEQTAISTATETFANPPVGGPFRFGIVGRGWRSRFFLRAAAALPQLLSVTGVVTRTAERGQDIEREWAVPTFRDSDALLGTGPEFVISSVPWDVNPPTITALVRAGMPVLAETPPAPTVEALRELWAAVGASGLVQIAEQYQFQPLQAARLALAAEGLLGTPTGVQLSSTHGYHAVSLIRLGLGVGFAEADVLARSFRAPLLTGFGHGGWPATAEEVPTDQTIAMLDFGSGGAGLYDFTDNQWWNPVRQHRHVIRGSHGEIVDSLVTTMADPGSPVSRPIVRRQTGVDGNLEGMFADTLSLDGRVLWRNRFAPARLSDEDIAIAEILTRTGSWARDRTQPQPYPLAQGSQDHLLSLAITESAATGRVVHTGIEPWAS